MRMDRLQALTRWRVPSGWHRSPVSTAWCLPWKSVVSFGVFRTGLGLSRLFAQGQSSATVLPVTPPLWRRQGRCRFPNSRPFSLRKSWLPDWAPGRPRCRHIECADREIAFDTLAYYPSLRDCTVNGLPKCSGLSAINSRAQDRKSSSANPNASSRSIGCI